MHTECGGTLLPCWVGNQTRPGSVSRLSCVGCTRVNSRDRYAVTIQCVCGYEIYTREKEKGNQEKGWKAGSHKRLRNLTTYRYNAYSYIPAYNKYAYVLRTCSGYDQQGRLYMHMHMHPARTVRTLAFFCSTAAILSGLENAAGVAIARVIGHQVT